MIPERIIFVSRGITVRGSDSRVSDCTTLLGRRGVSIGLAFVVVVSLLNA